MFISLLVKAAEILNFDTSVMSTPSISSLNGSFIPSDLWIMILSAVRLMKRSLNASVISESEWRLKFSLESSSLLKTFDAVVVRMLTYMKVFKGLGLYPKKYGLGVLQICISSIFKNLSSLVTKRFVPGSLYRIVASTAIGYIFFTLSRYISIKSGIPFFSFFSSDFMSWLSKEAPIRMELTK